MISNRTVRLLALFAMTPALSSGCWEVPDDDAGDEAFVAWAVPTVLARRPYSHNEVAALARLAEEQGREAVLDVLMDQPEFTTYWSRVLVDDLRLQRGIGGSFTVDGDCYGEGLLSSVYDDQLVEHLRSASWQDPFCPEEPGYTDTYTTKSSSSSSSSTRDGGGREDTGYDLTAEALATYQETRASGDYIQTAPSIDGGIPPVGPDGRQELRTMDSSTEQTAFPPFGGGKISSSARCKSFNMTDVFRASLGEDRLDAAVRAQMPVLAAFGGGTGRMSSAFQLGWLDRDPACLGCHTTTYSTSDARPLNEDWDRFHPADPGVDVEGSAYSYYDGGAFFYGGGGTTTLDGFFRSDIRVEEGTSAFGLAPECIGGGFDPAPGDSSDHPAAAFAGLELGEGYSVMDLVDRLRDGLVSYAPDALQSVPNSVAPASADDDCGVEDAKGSGCETLFNAQCAGCHAGANAPSDLLSHTAHMTPDRLYSIVVYGSPAGGMDPIALGEDDDPLTDESLRELVAWMVEAPEHEALPLYSEPADGFAHLVAQSMVNHVVEEVSGSRLALAHGHPRIPEAADAQGLLTAQLLATWSLRDVIKQAVLSEFANRRAPAEAKAGAYELPPLLEPWDLANVDALGPGEFVTSAQVYNGEGDEVHRWSVPSLLLQLHHALGWNEPPIIPTGSFPSSTFREEIGAFVNNDSVGFTAPDFSAMLAWEEEVAACIPNGGSTPTEDVGQSEEEWGDDYVGLVTSEAAGLTVEEAMLAVKDRLISYGAWWGDGGDFDELALAGGETDPGERALAAELAASMDGAALSDPAHEAPDAVRAYCGALLRSPQFLLAGLAAWPDDVPPATPGELPCNDELCSYWDYCEAYQEAARDHGYGGFECNDAADTLTFGRE